LLTFSTLERPDTGKKKGGKYKKKSPCRQGPGNGIVVIATVEGRKDQILAFAKRWSKEGKMRTHVRNSLLYEHGSRKAKALLYAESRWGKFEGPRFPARRRRKKEKVAPEGRFASA